MQKLVARGRVVVAVFAVVFILAPLALAQAPSARPERRDRPPGPPSSSANGRPHLGPRPFPSGSARGSLGSTRRERRAQRIAEVRRSYGPLLRDPGARAELRAHARRMALLHRAEVVARTELDEPKRGKALARVAALLEKERTRHTKRMQKLAGPGAAGPNGSVKAPHAPTLPPAKGSAP